EHGKGRLVARLATAIFHRFEQRTLLTLDVSAGADERLQRDGEPGAKDIVAADPGFACLGQRLLYSLDLFLVLVANIDKALRSSGHKPGQHHSFDHQVRGTAE